MRTGLLIACGLVLVPAAQLQATEAADLAGQWCFYEQSMMGETVPEKVDIALNADGSYSWQQGPFVQNGNWEVTDGQLKMTDVGSHDIIEVGGGEMVLERYSTMKFRSGECDDSSFSDMDVTAFHNAASTGDVDVIRDYLGRGIDPDSADFMRGDTALIKAAKFCRIDAAQVLLDEGASADVRNDSDKAAVDFAKSSSFHDGCDELVSMLE